MYWPEIGRFISVDSAGPDTANPTTFNRYAYVLNNPYKYVDPNGHVATWATGLLGLFLGGAYGAITSALSDEGFNWNAVTYWGGAGAVAGLTLGLGVNAYLAATATVSVAELTATMAPTIGIAATEAGATPKILQSAAENANKLTHIFGDPGHNLAPVVEHFGSEEAAFQAIRTATEAAVNAEGITAGTFESLVETGGFDITVRGNIVEDLIRIGTAFIESE